MIEYCITNYSVLEDGVSMLGYSNGSAMTLHYLLEGSYKLNNVLCNVTVFSDEQWDGEDKLLSLRGGEEVKPDLSSTKITFCMGGEDTIIPFNGGEFLEEYIHPSLDVINFLASYKEGNSVEEETVESVSKNLDLYCYKKQDVALYYLRNNIYGKNETVIKHINHLLTNAVKKRLLSERPVGCLLSGGLDSSIVTAIMAKRVGAKNLKTFSLFSKLFSIDGNSL